MSEQSARLEPRGAPRDLGALMAALGDHLLGGDQITSIAPLSGGHSNETYLLEGVDLILRLPPSQAPLVASARGIRSQFELFAVVHGLPGMPPVPAVRYLCDDDTVVGAPFYLMERVAGEALSEYEVTPWIAAGDARLRASVTTQWCQAIAAVNRHAPLDVLGPPRSIPEELARWERVARGAQNDGLVELFGVLAGRTPRPTGDAAVVHGDPKPANTMWRDSRLVGLLDWEMAFNGDPAWDLGYMLVALPSELHPAFPGWDLPGLGTREDLIATWEQATGRSAGDHLWFETASVAKIATIIAYGAHLAATGKSTDPRLAAWGPFAEQYVDLTAAMCAALTKRSD